MNRRQLKDRVEAMMKKATGDSLEALTALYEALDKNASDARIKQLRRQAGI